eukprot:NODE_631_length_5203_cov_0.313480.p1 type:complete len:505 gc:universal NODE_631_length_5203_cov_0.313480:2735-1221(-)
MFKRIAGLSFVGFSAFTYQADPKEYAYKRPILFWGVLTPIFCHYKYIEYKTQDLPEDIQDIEFTRLHTKYAPIILDMFLNLRGLFIKLGQVACSRQDVLPKEYRDVFKVLLDHAPHVEGQEAIDLVESAIKQPISNIFKEFDPIPLGSASIGQVHAAKLINNQDVVIKIQFKETKKSFDLDFKNGRFFCELARPDQLPFIDEFEKQFKMEFDFLREANMLQRVGNNIHPHFKNVKIPVPYLEYCTPTCLVMERFYGHKLLDGFQFRLNDYAKKMGYANISELQAHFKRVEHSKWKYALMTRNFMLYSYSISLEWLKKCYNHTFGLIFPKFQFNQWQLINANEITSTIFKVHAHQIFKNGVFNGDPHIGNIWILENGNIGLIDYGQVKEINESTIHDLKILYKSLNSNQIQQTFDIYTKMGFKSQFMNPQITFEKVLLQMDREDATLMKNRNIPQYMEYLEKQDKTIKFPTDVIMVFRTAMLLRGLAAMMTGKKWSVSEAWKDYY